MDVAIDGHVISEKAVLWLLQYGWTVLNMSDYEFALFQLAVKYNMTEEEMNLLFKERENGTSNYLSGKVIRRNSRKRQGNQGTGSNI